MLDKSFLQALSLPTAGTGITGRGTLSPDPPCAQVCKWFWHLEQYWGFQTAFLGVPSGRSPVWLSCKVLLLHWDSPTMATILAPRLERLFLVMVTESALPRTLCSMLYISPLMLELRMTLRAAEELASPLNMVRRSPAPLLGISCALLGEAGGHVNATNAGRWHWPCHRAPTQSGPTGLPDAVQRLLPSLPHEYLNSSGMEHPSSKER